MIRDYQWPDSVPSQFFKFVSNLKKLRWIHVTMRTVNYVERPNCLSWLIHVIMRKDNNVEGPNFLSNELRYINWRNYPASPFPNSFQPMNLVVLKMECSFQKELWRSHKVIQWFPNIINEWIQLFISFKNKKSTL